MWKPGVNEKNVEAVRTMYHEGYTEEQLSSSFQIDLETIDKILEGSIMETVGGPLRPLPLQGCNPRRYPSERNKRQFAQAVLKRAKAILERDDFTRLANYNGLTVGEADSSCYNLEYLDEQEQCRRYSVELRRQAEGASGTESD